MARKPRSDASMDEEQDKKRASRIMDALEVAVPLRIAQWRKIEGPTDGDLEFAREVLADRIACGSDVLYGGAKKGQVASQFNAIADALSILAWGPDGVTFWGRHFCARENCGWCAREDSTGTTAKQED